MQTLLKNAYVYIGNGFRLSDILVEDGRIASVGNGRSYSCAEDACVYDLTGRYIFPGFVDVHVHFREPGFSYKETIRTGSMAAAAGGYTDVCTMPNLDPVPDCAANLKAETDAIAQDAVVNVYPYGSITRGEKGLELSDLEEIAGDVIAFSDDGKGLESDTLMLEAMKRAGNLDRLIAAHCEDMSCIEGSRVNKGKVAKRLGITGITSESEWRMIERDIDLAAEAGCRYHVCHVSTAESLDIIRRAKEKGIDVTCETAPHYILLSDADIDRALDSESPSRLGRFKMNPPLRSVNDRKAVLEALLDGTIDMIATDHAPHSDEEKAGGIMLGPMGVVGLECAFPVLYSELVKKDIMDLAELVRLMSIAPASRFGIECGIETGRTAKLCVYDLDEQYRIDPSTFRSKGRYTPFEGKTVYGRCLITICGDHVYEYGKSGEDAFCRRF